MNYAFIDSMGSLTYNNGIKIQAIMWKNGLENWGTTLNWLICGRILTSQVMML